MTAGDAQAARRRRQARERTAIGWREWVQLADFDVAPIKAKVDTGARTSSLHAFGLHVEEGVEGPVARFEIHPVQRSRSAAVVVEAPVTGWRAVRPSTGQQELRPVVRTRIILGGRKIRIELTLSRRDEMGFRMLIGRAALRHRFVVDPGRSFLGGAPTSDTTGGRE